MLDTNVSYRFVLFEVICQYAEGELFAFVFPANHLSIDIDDHFYYAFGFLVKGTAYLPPLPVFFFFVPVRIVDLSSSNV